ncbi:MAG: hypothetical protein JXB07_16390, partial [Anaerolineae bacterium]|nr:hypothetical protein [Anaerolineae bacterium]
RLRIHIFTCLHIYSPHMIVSRKLSWRSIFVGYVNAKEHTSPGQHPECFDGMLCVSVDSRLRGNDKLVRE